MSFVLAANKLDMTYDFYVKHRMQMVQWQLNKSTNEDRNLIKKLPQNCIHPLNRNFEIYQVNFL